MRGAESVAIGSILDVKQLDDMPKTRTAITQLAMGYVGAAEVAEAAGVVVNGELAKLGDRIGGYRRGLLNLNWGATVLWIAL